MIPHTADEPRPGEQALGGRNHAAPFEQMETLSPERLHRARQGHRAYYRWLRLSRLALAAFVVIAAASVLWLLPWLPSGLDTEDYTPELAFTVYLLGAVAITGMLGLSLRELAQRDRESLMVWATVYDEATGLHNRTYLYDRLSLECERAKRRNGVFSVIVLKIRIAGSAPGPPPTLSNAALQEVAGLLDRLLRPADLVALLNGGELAILAIGLNQEERQPLLERLRGTVVAGLPRYLDGSAIIDVKGGAATYGVDGNDAAALIQAARAVAILALPRRGQAA